MIKVTVWDPRFGIATAPVPPAAFVFPRVLVIRTPHCKRENGLIDDVSESEARLREREVERERERVRNEATQYGVENPSFEIGACRGEAPTSGAMDR
jgi:hypothetical protein